VLSAAELPPSAARAEVASHLQDASSLGALDKTVHTAQIVALAAQDLDAVG
jgi:hypothetical protein